MKHRLTIGLSIGAALARIFFALACVGFSVHCSRGAEDELIGVSPTEYRGGPFPEWVYTWNYAIFPTTPGSIPAISDGSLETFTHLEGLDSVGNPPFDTGTFYTLRYRVPTDAVRFRIDFTARLNYAQEGSAFFLSTLNPDGSGRSIGHFNVLIGEISNFGIQFLEHSNDGNLPNQIGVRELMDANGEFTFILTSGFGASINRAGNLTSDLFEVNARYSFVVPEPRPVTLLFIVLLASLFAPRGKRLRERFL